MLKKNGIPRSVPEDQGVSSAAILTFVEEIERRQLELHGFMILRHDHVIGEGWWAPYRPEYPHMAFSLTKSFTSTAIGFAVQEGLVSVDDLVLSYFPEEVTEEIRQNMGELTIKHLLSMSTGHIEETTRFNVNHSFMQDRPNLRIGDRLDGDWVRGFFELPIQRRAGTHFIYNSGASHLLATIIQKVSGQNVLEYLNSRLFIPLGIEKPTWEACPTGNISGGWGLRLKTEDIARFGQMLLRKGMWYGERVLNEAWIEEASSKQVETNSQGNQDWLQGYGYQFWICQHNAYRGDGAFGQYCIVMPDQDAVIAINSGLQDMQEVLNAVWEHLLPAMKERILSPDALSQQRLQQKLTSLALGEQGGVHSGEIAGTKRYKIEPNEDNVDEIVFHFSDTQITFVWRDGAGEHSFSCGIGEWDEQNQLADEKVAAKGVWRDDKKLVIDLYRIHTPHHDRLTCVFEGSALNIRHEHLDFISKERHLIGMELDVRDFLSQTGSSLQ